MKHIVFIFLFFLTLNISAQIPENPNAVDDTGNKQGTWTILFDPSFNITGDESQASYYRIIKYIDNMPSGIIRDYYLNGNKQWEGYLIKEEPDPVYDSLCIWYHETGYKSQEVLFDEGAIINIKYFNLDGSEVGVSFDSLNTWGWEAYYQSDFNKARSFFQKAVDQAERQYGSVSLYFGFAGYALGSVEKAIGNKDKALEYYLESIETYRNSIGVENQYYIWSANEIAKTFKENGDFIKSLEFFKQIAKIQQALYSSDHPEYALVLNDLAIIYEELDSIESAHQCYNEALAIYEGLPNLEEDYITILENAALFLVDYEVDIKESERLFRKELILIDSIHGQDNLPYVTALRNIAGLCRTQNRSIEAMELLKDALDIVADIESTESINYMNLLDDLAGNYLDIDDFVNAELLYLEAVRIAKKYFNETELGYNIQLNNLGLVYLELRKFRQSDSLFTLVVENYSNTIGRNHPECITAMVNLARVYTESSKYPEAEKLLTEALNYSELAGQEGSLDYIFILQNLADLYLETGSYDQAEKMLVNVIEITNEILGSDNLDYASAVNSLANLYNKTGNLVEAEKLYIEALNIRQAKKDISPLYYSISLNDLGIFYKDLGNYSKAEELLSESLNIYTEVMGEGDPALANTIQNLGLVYLNTEVYSKAENCFLRAIEIYKSSPDGVTTDYGGYLNNLGLLYDKMKRYEEAEAVYLEAQDIFISYFGRDHMLTAANLNNMGVLYQMMGDYEKAKVMLLESLDIYISFFGEDYPKSITLLNNLGFLYSHTNEPEKGDRFYLESVNRKVQQILNLFPIMSKEEKKQFVVSNSLFFKNFYIHCLNRYGENPGLLGAWYNIQLIIKGILLNASNKMRERIISSKDEQLIQLFKDWKTRQDYLSHVLRMSINARKQAGIQVNQLEEDINRIEKELTSRSELFAEVTDNNVYSWTDVRDILGPDEAAIELIRTVRINDDINDQVYVALIVKKDTQEYPEIVVFGNADLMETRHLQYNRNSIRFKSKDENSFSVFWDPLKSSLKDINRVYLSPDGIYNQISLNTLWDPDDQNFLIDQIDLVVVGNTKDLLTKGDKELAIGDIQDATLFGFASFNKKLNSDDPESTDSENLIFASSEIFEDSVSYRFLNGDEISMLPGTLAEVQSISSSLIANQIQVSEFTHDQASENKIKDLSNPDILHIATHGYFLSDIRISEEEGIRFAGIETQQIAENPLFRSGLLFAGAASAFYESKDRDLSKEDGILTAYEAMNLDLDETKLVILSACETGLGVTSNGEGVYGLQRAFQVAGSTAVMMSLWTVSDEATQKMMILFYDEWLGGQPIRQAFLNAQLTLRQDYPNPHDWGAFVLIGI
ncbi:tetratricopeptide repeat protein [Bacteroidota bacterium]